MCSCHRIHGGGPSAAALVAEAAKAKADLAEAWKRADTTIETSRL